MGRYFNMDKYLKLKLDLTYRDLSIEQARQVFETIKNTPDTIVETLKIRKTRKRIPAKK